ncbi:MAG: T9SS type A sorting domain-containing protein [Chitinophagales bacterium]|nr:T9SS type A sorting domain-containing protein [Chitinophagales bacterium]
MYDPKQDRFVFIAMYGYWDLDTSIYTLGTLTAFSKSNDPIDGWNFYYFPDSLLNDGSTVDYPQLGMTNDEAFVTMLRFDQDGNLTHSLILQEDKNAGYAGASTITSQIFNVPLTGITLGSVVPASGGSTTYGPKMYFMMADETGNEADSFFVLEVSNTIASGSAILKTYGAFHSNLDYLPAGFSKQPGNLYLTDVNAEYDDFVMSAFYENGLIQFCQNTNVNGKAGIYLGRISRSPAATIVTAQTIGYSNLFLSFPSIAYAGKGMGDNSLIMNVPYTGKHIFPGTASIYMNSNFKTSPLKLVKAGNDTINSYWGDYSGICRRYNNPGECWLIGQYGSTTPLSINWIAQLFNPDLQFRNLNESVESKSIVQVFPNPFSQSTTISFTLSQAEKISLNIYDLSGRVVKVLADEIINTGKHELEWNSTDQNGNIEPAGIYLLRMQTGNENETIRLSVVK